MEPVKRGRGRPRKDPADLAVKKPKPPTGKRIGRPRLEETKSTILMVERLASVGMSEDDIAEAIGIPQQRLVSHYVEALKRGPAKQRAAIVDKLYQAALKKGSTPALKFLYEATGAATANAGIKAKMANARQAPEPVEAEAKPEKLGKKETKQRAAESVGGIFAPRVGLKLQ